MGKRKCFFPGCISNQAIQDDEAHTRYSLYSFPNPKKFFSTYEKWLDFCQIPLDLAEATITNNSRICSGHFLPLCFNPGSKTLKKGAIPSLFPPTTPSGMSLSLNESALECEVAANIVEPAVHPREQVITFTDISKFCQNFASSHRLYVFREVTFTARSKKKPK